MRSPHPVPVSRQSDPIPSTAGCTESVCISRSWTPREDEVILRLVEKLGDQHWDQIAASLSNRTARRCRERFRNYLAPSPPQTTWTDSENSLLLRLQRQIGTRWKVISGHFPGRTEACVKNHWLQLMRRSAPPIPEDPLTDECVVGCLAPKRPTLFLDPGDLTWLSQIV
jgi:hypothetical protein